MLHRASCSLQQPRPAGDHFCSELTCRLQARVKDVEAQLTQVNTQLAQLRHQQQELEIQNQVLEDKTQTHSSLSPTAEVVFLWKVTLLLRLHSQVRHTPSSFVLPHSGGCSLA